MSTQPSPEKKQADLQAINSLSIQMRELVATHEHAIALTALLSTLVELGIAHPCCTQSIANLMMQNAMVLATAAAAARPASALVH